jgi:hypothetical protein
LASIFILVDGARADVFYEMLSQGLLPNIDKHIAKRGVVVKDALTYSR